MVNVEEKEHYFQYKAIDDQGDVEIEISKDCRQFRIQTGLDQAFFDCNRYELKRLRDMIDEAIRLNED